MSETSAQLKRLIFNLRSVISIILVNLAIKAAPAEEKDSLVIAAYEHSLRCIANEQAGNTPEKAA